MPPDDHRPGGPAPDLYETDFYLWTQAQAEALRAEARRGGAVEWERVAEEIEDMGKSDLRQCYSRIETIIEHLLKLTWSLHAEPRNGWKETIERERNAIELVITATLRKHVEATLETRHGRALKLAILAFEHAEPSAPRDLSLRWTLAQILGEENDPIG